MRTDRVLRFGVLATLLVGGFGSAGCEHMNNTEKGAGIGGALGAGAGLAVGAATGNPRTGAAVGGLLGAGTGALIGNDVDRQEKRDRDFQQAAATAQATAQAQAQQQRMGMFDVIHMTQAGHDDQVIINQIRTTGSTFQLTPSDLDNLKAQGVSPAVITAMQTARPVSPFPARVVVREPAPPTTVIYAEQPPPAVIVAPRPYYYYGGGYYRRW